MGTPALGSVGIAFEPTSAPGEQPILTYQAVAPTLSATNQPSGSTGMRFHLYVYNNTATGTITIAGKDINGNSITETTSTIPIFPANAINSEQGRFDYVTTNVYSTINASGITSTGLTNGNLKMGGIYAAKYLLPCTVKITPKYGSESPNEHRGIPDMDTHKIQTIKDVDVQVDQTVYPDGSLWVPYATMNSATSPTTPTSSPGTPTSLLASAAVSGSPLSLTTQPSAPEMRLILTVTGAGAAGTIAITGTNPNGVALTETISGAGNGTFYSGNRYASVNASGIVVTGFTAGSLAISGVYGYNRTMLPSLNPNSTTLEWYTGTDSVCVPYAVFSEATLTFDVEKELSWSLKGIAQDYLQIGDRTTNPLATTRVNQLAQPMDAPMAGWQVLVYIDPISNAPGSTLFGDLVSGKITWKTPLKAIHKATNQQVFNTIYRQKFSVDFEAKIDYTNVLQAEQFRRDAKQYIVIQFIGRNIGGGNYTTINIILPFKFNKFETTGEPGGTNVEADIAGIAEYDPGIGGSYKIQWLNNTLPPTYTN